MNQLLLNLAMAALSQFGGMGRLPAPGFGGGLPPGLGGGSGLPFQPRPNPVVLRPSLELATRAGVTCLERQGRLSPGDGPSLLRSQGQLFGWPADWDRAVNPAAVERLISRAGGCTPLLQALRRGGLRYGDEGIARGNGSGGGASDSEAEGFGLTPYR